MLKMLHLGTGCDVAEISRTRADCCPGSSSQCSRSATVVIWSLGWSWSTLPGQETDAFKLTQSWYAGGGGGGTQDWPFISATELITACFRTIVVAPVTSKTSNILDGEDEKQRESGPVHQKNSTDLMSWVVLLTTVIIGLSTLCVNNRVFHSFHAFEIVPRQPCWVFENWSSMNIKYISF